MQNLTDSIAALFMFTKFRSQCMYEDIMHGSGLAHLHDVIPALGW